MILACLCATTAKVSSCNRHSIAHKPYNIFCLDLHKKEKFADSCPKETEVHRAQWHKNNARQSEEKSRGWQGRREHWGDAERKGWGRQVCRGRWGEAQRQGLASQATWKGGQPQKAEHAIFRNHLQELTDLSANPGVHQTAPETSVQLCTPGWSRVPGEKMLSGKIPGSVLGKQRQTHDRESQGGWTQGNHGLSGSVVTCPGKGNPPCDPKLLLTPCFTLMTWEWEILFETIFDQIQITARFR